MRYSKRIDRLEERLDEALVELVILNQRTCKHKWELSGSESRTSALRRGFPLNMSSCYKKTCTKCGKFEYLGESAYHELKRLEAQKIVDECNKKLAE